MKSKIAFLGLLMAFLGCDSQGIHETSYPNLKIDSFQLNQQGGGDQLVEITKHNNAYYLQILRCNFETVELEPEKINESDLKNQLDKVFNDEAEIVSVYYDDPAPTGTSRDLIVKTDTEELKISNPAVKIDGQSTDLLTELQAASGCYNNLDII